MENVQKTKNFSTALLYLRCVFRSIPTNFRCVLRTGASRRRQTMVVKFRDPGSRDAELPAGDCPERDTERVGGEQDGAKKAADTVEGFGIRTSFNGDTGHHLAVENVEKSLTAQAA